MANQSLITAAQQASQAQHATNKPHDYLADIVKNYMEFKKKTDAQDTKHKGWVETLKEGEFDFSLLPSDNEFSADFVSRMESDYKAKLDEIILLKQEAENLSADSEEYQVVVDKINQGKQWIKNRTQSLNDLVTIRQNVAEFGENYTTRMNADRRGFILGLGDGSSWEHVNSDDASGHLTYHANELTTMENTIDPRDGGVQILEETNKEIVRLGDLKLPSDNSIGKMQSVLAAIEQSAVDDAIGGRHFIAKNTRSFIEGHVSDIKGGKDGKNQLYNFMRHGMDGEETGVTSFMEHWYQQNSDELSKPQLDLVMSGGTVTVGDKTYNYENLESEFVDWLVDSAEEVHADTWDNNTDPNSGENLSERKFRANNRLGEFKPQRGSSSSYKTNAQSMYAGVTASKAVNRAEGAEVTDSRGNVYRWYTTGMHSGKWVHHMKADGSPVALNNASYFTDKTLLQTKAFTAFQGKESRFDANGRYIGR